jgi:CRP/FNR family transcriptional regulator, dissimilatory nitrate respiration regulator
MIDLPVHIRRLGRETPFRQGAFLFQAEDRAAAFYLILSGEIRVFKMDEQGRELEVARLGAGDFVGEAFALVHERLPFFAQAVRDVRTLVFDLPAAEKAIASDPEAARYFVRLLARKCIQLSGRVESLGLKTVRRRLAEFLLSRCQGGGICAIELPMRKGELAKTLGTVGETLSRTLRQMQDDRLIEVDGKTIRVVDCPGLRRETGS